MKARNKKGLKGGLIIGLVAATVGVFVGSSFIKEYVSSTSYADQQQNLDPTQVGLPTTVRGQAERYNEAFNRLLSLGYAARTITLNDNGDYDMQNTLKFVPKMVLAKQYFDQGPSLWQLGGGQIAGAFAKRTPDIVIYVTGLNNQVCKSLNDEIWGDEFDKIPKTDISSLDWKAQKANLLKVFSGRDLPEGCIKTKEDQNLYYRVVSKQ
ncbi:MAG: hypothetical protein AAFY76_20660 [Cyanobacteria bacterium J06649_11]